MIAQRRTAGQAHAPPLGTYRAWYGPCSTGAWGVPGARRRQASCPSRRLYLCRTACTAEVTQIAQGTTYMGILIKAPTRRRDGVLNPLLAAEVVGEPSGALHIREVVR